MIGVTRSPLLWLGAVAAMSGCHQAPSAPAAGVARAPETPAPLQHELCLTDNVVIESGCTPGQRAVFLPPRWGNEQLPVSFAAMNCDLRYSVVMTNGGVTCIYLPARSPQAAEAGAAASAPGAGPQPGTPSRP